jgi:microcystin degradation protein MlrC
MVCQDRLGTNMRKPLGTRVVPARRPTVFLRVKGIDVLVTTGRNQTFDPVIFRTHGIDVTKYRIIALKSSIHFRAGFRELPNGFKPKIMVTDPPGLSR